MLHRLILICALLLLLPSLAQGQTVTDAMGFAWDFAEGASVNDGSDDAFDGGLILQVGGSQYNGSGQGVEKDGMLVFGAQTIAGVTVTRHVLLIQDPPGLVYADSFHNPGKDSQSVSPVVNSDFGDSATPQVKSNSDGKMVAMLYMHRPNRPLIAFHFGESTTDYLPTLSGSSDTYQFTFPPLEIGPGETKSIGYFVGQRRPGTGEKTFADEEAFRKSVLKILEKKTFSFANLPRFGLYGTGKLKLIARASNDFIQTLKKDKVYGDLLTSEFELETAIGKRVYKSDEIVNAVRFGAENYAVAASDGSILEGKLSPEKVKFQLSDGGEGEIELRNIEALVPREPKTEMKPRKQGQWFEFKSPIFAFVSQDRLTGTPISKTLKVHTSIGVIDVPIASVQTIEMEQGKDRQQPKFTMLDGQSFTGFLYEDIEVKIFDGSTMNISPKNLKTVFLTAPANLGTKSVPTDQPYLSLSATSHLLVEFLTDQRPLEFTSLFGTQTISPEQILKLESSPGLATGTHITFWDGSKIQGELTGKTFLVKIFDQQREIPIEMIREFHNPLALPPESVRKEYLELIELLGSNKYGERTRALKVLQENKVKLRGLFRSQIQNVGVEAKTRLWQLLPKEDRPKKGKKPKVKKEEKKEGVKEAAPAQRVANPAAVAQPEQEPQVEEEVEQVEEVEEQAKAEQAAVPAVRE